MGMKFEKNMRIITDLMAYCHTKGAHNFHVDIEFQKGGAHYKIEAAIENYCTEELEELRERLSAPRQPNVESDYWGLGGDVDTDPEIELIGMMISDAKVEYSGGFLKIDILRED